MSGYRYQRTQQEATNNNDGTVVIDGGNSNTNYLVQFDNGQANNDGQTNPVVINFGGAT